VGAIVGEAGGIGVALTVALAGKGDDADGVTGADGATGVAVIWRGGALQAASRPSKRMAESKVGKEAGRM